MKRRSLWFILAGGVLAVVLAVALIWNKPHETVDNQEGEAITAVALTNAFLQDEQTANTTYLNKVLEVSGTVSEVTTNQDNKKVVLLEAEDPLSGVQGTMKDEAVQVSVGQQLTIKGFCNGYTTVVLLSDCIINDK